VIIMLGLFGAALFYGDGVITPAISVLSAVEGLEVITPAFKPFVIPLALVILVGLFVIQRHGTASVGKLVRAGDAALVRHAGVLGINSIVAEPGVLRALNPAGRSPFSRQPRARFFSLGAVVLVLTGGEALYADMGHFGRRPIQLAWFAMVLPAC
jgi:KUP system potassium uptake protein